MVDTPPDLKTSLFRERHLRDYWKVVWQGRWTILAIFLLVAGAAAIWSFLQVPIYQAVVTVEINPKPRGIVTGQDVSGMGATGMSWLAEERYLNTQIEIMGSRDVAGRVVRLLDLESHPQFEKLADPIDAFRSMVRVDPRRQTDLIEISMTGTNKDEITQWVNAVAQAYVDRNFEKAHENVDRAVQSIHQQIASLNEKLSVAETERIDTLERTQIYDSENQKAIVSQKLQKYNTDLNETQIDKAALSETLRQIREMRAQGRDLMTLAELREDQTLQDLLHSKMDTENELAKVKVQMRSEHPKYEEMQNTLKGLNEKIDERMDVIIHGLENLYQQANEREKFLSARIREAENYALDVAKATSQYDIVKTDSETKKRVFDMINKTMNEVQLAAELMTNNVTIVDDATPPLFPIKPRKRLNLAIGMMFGLFLGVAAVFFLEYLDNTVRTPEDVEKFLGLSVLGVIPKMAEQGMSSRAVKEAYNSLRTSIIFSSKNRQRKVILITSTGPQEGKSSNVANLGRILAGAGDQVIIVDCDMRRPTQHTHHGLDRDHGLTNYLAAPDHEKDWAAYVKAATPPNLHVMTCGPIPPSPPELLGNERFSELLTSLRDHYDWILVDSPPAASLADASLLASLADMIVLVVQHNRTDRDLVIKTLQAVRAVNATVAGVVLNNVDLDRTYHKDYYYAGYYYYSEDEPQTRKRKVERKVG